MQILSQNSSACTLDDLPLQKFMAVEKMGKVLKMVSEHNEKPLTRTAAGDIDANALVTLFSHMLQCLSLKTGNSENVSQLLDRLSSKLEQGDLTKSAASRPKERHDDIKIASKRVRDSHYQVDLSKDVISKFGKKVYMVSCYARDAYLGRYLVKRNFYFTADREAAADEAYEEILHKMAALKERYHSDIIDVSAISTQFRKILDGVVSEIASEEDDLATNARK